MMNLRFVVLVLIPRNSYKIENENENENENESEDEDERGNAGQN